MSPVRHVPFPGVRGPRWCRVRSAVIDCLSSPRSRAITRRSRPGSSPRDPAARLRCQGRGSSAWAAGPDRPRPSRDTPRRPIGGPAGRKPRRARSTFPEAPGRSRNAPAGVAGRFARRRATPRKDMEQMRPPAAEIPPAPSGGIGRGPWRRSRASNSGGLMRHPRKRTGCWDGRSTLDRFGTKLDRPEMPLASEHATPRGLDFSGFVYSRKSAEFRSVS